MAVWGLDCAERFRRLFARRGGRTSDWLGQAPQTGPVTLIRRDCVIEENLLAVLDEHVEAVLLDEDGVTALAARVPAERAPEAARYLETARWLETGRDAPAPEVTPVELIPAYDEDVRRQRSMPMARLVDAENRARTEQGLFRIVYKGVTDAVTRYILPYPAYALTRAAVRLGVTPNAVTAVWIGLALLALVLFGLGAFGWGLAAAWAVALLDSVDGKLARVTMQASRFGGAMERIASFALPPLWYAAWLVGLSRTGAMSGPWEWIVALGVGGYALCRLEEAWFRRRHGIELHVWRRFDTRFRLVSARRNPHLAVMTLFALAGAPYVAVAAVAAWTGVTAAVQGARIAAAEAARRRGGLHPWMAPDGD